MNGGDIYSRPLIGSLATSRTFHYECDKFQAEARDIKDGN